MNINAPVNINEPDLNINGAYNDGSYLDRDGERFWPTPAIRTNLKAPTKRYRTVEGYDDDHGHIGLTRGRRR